jgi:hypothetical protein
VGIRAASWVTDSGWNVVSATLGALGLIAAYVFYRRSQQPKTLDWVMIFDRFMGTGPAASSGLTVAFKGTQVLLPRLAVIRIHNTGKQAIRPEDYHGALTIEAPGARIHSVEYVGAVPSEVLADHPEAQLAGESMARLAPVLLNAGELYILQCVVDGGKPGGLTVTGRIAGQSRPTRRVEQGLPARQVRLYTLFSFIINVMIGAIVLSVGYIFSRIPNPAREFKSLVIAIVPMIVVITILQWAVATRAYKLSLRLKWPSSMSFRSRSQR